MDGKRQLNIGWEYNTSALSPFVPIGGPYGSYYFNCLETLCAYDAHYNMYNVLAKDWSVDENGTVCTAERKNIRIPMLSCQTPFRRLVTRIGICL